MGPPRENPQDWAPAVAAADYQSRRNRSAKTDGAVGAMLAGYVQAEKWLRDWTRKAIIQVRKGEKPERPQRLPDWIRAEALPFARRFAVQFKADLPLVLDPLLFEQIVADAPMSSFCAQLDAVVTSEGTGNAEELKACGEQWEAALTAAHPAHETIEKTPHEDLGAIAATCGRRFIKAVHEHDSKGKRGRAIDVFGDAFIVGVKYVFSNAGMGAPEPLDLAEIAVVWGIDGGPPGKVLLRWKGKLSQFRRRRKGVGKLAKT